MILVFGCGWELKGEMYVDYFAALRFCASLSGRVIVFLCFSAVDLRYKFLWKCMITCGYAMWNSVQHLDFSHHWANISPIPWSRSRPPRRCERPHRQPRRSFEGDSKDSMWRRRWFCHDLPRKASVDRQISLEKAEHCSSTANWEKKVD